jgi:RimJ/RimL family protein N-acetyltransferase
VSSLDGVTELQTARLRLRRWRDDDLERLAELNADPRVTRWLTPTGAPIPPDETAAQLARFRRHWGEHRFGIWAVEERATGSLLGRIGVQYHRLWPDEPELGWTLDPAVWGRGYATEGGAAALRHAFETLGRDRIVSIIHPRNRPSVRVAERLGFAPHARVDWPEGGAELDVYAVGRDEWARLQSSA